MLKKTNFTKNGKTLFVEFISILFAVFLALIANQWNENIKHTKLAKQSINNIKTEIQNNSNTLDSMLVKHKIIIDAFENAISAPDTSESEMDISVTFSLISSNAWETTKLTQAISYINFETVSDISAIYQYQSYYETLINNYALNYLMTASEIDTIEEAKQQLNKLKSIYQIESKLSGYYKNLLPKLKTTK